MHSGSHFDGMSTFCFALHVMQPFLLGRASPVLEEKASVPGPAALWST